MLLYSIVVMQASQQLNKSKFFFRASSQQRAAAGLVFVMVVGFFGLFALLAKGKIDIGRWLDPCGFKQRYELPCPTCGMTTSILAFVQGKIFEAFYIQPAGALLCCVLAVSGFLAFLASVFGVYPGFVKRLFTEVKIKYIILALIIIVAAGWAVTLARAFGSGD